jgi:hypothetical protein
MKQELTTVDIYSPIHDNKIKSNISGSEIWNECYHEDELSKDKRKEMFRYTMKFSGTKPVQVTNIKRG